MPDEPSAPTLAEFVLARLAEDEHRVRSGRVPFLDEAERRGRLRFAHAHGHQGLLLTAGPVVALEDRQPVSFGEKADYLRREIHDRRDDATAKLIASVYEAHPDWQPAWRP